MQAGNTTGRIPKPEATPALRFFFFGRTLSYTEVPRAYSTVQNFTTEQVKIPNLKSYVKTTQNIYRGTNQEK